MKTLVIEREAVKNNIGVIKERAGEAVIYAVLTGDGQGAGLVELARLLRAAGYELAAYTGYTFEQLYAMEDPAIRDLLGQLEILVDGPFVETERSLSLRFRGSRNQRIIDLPKSLAAGKAVLCTAERWTGEEA